MGISEILFLDNLRSNFSQSVVLSLELSSSLLGGGIKTENEILLLISFCERVESLLRVVEMSRVSEPSWLGDLIEEES